MPGGVEPGDIGDGDDGGITDEPPIGPVDSGFARKTALAASRLWEGAREPDLPRQLDRRAAPDDWIILAIKKGGSNRNRLFNINNRSLDQFA